MTNYEDLLPYHSVFIDCTVSDIAKAAKACAFKPPMSRDEILSKIESLVKSRNRLPMVNLSVRTGLDLYLSAKNYPSGSEVLMSAINIPNMVELVHHKGLKVVPIDIDPSTALPNFSLLPDLITERTKAILVAHVFGKIVNMEEVLFYAKRYKLDVIEDCAESFTSMSNWGHPACDISLFSFGTIKSSTALGGAISLIKNESIFKQMNSLQNSLPVQPTSIFAKKLLKTVICIATLNNVHLKKPLMYFFRKINFDYQKSIAGLLRGFPNDWIKGIRQRPCDALLYMLYLRLSEWKEDGMLLTKKKGDYVVKRLRDVEFYGQQSFHNHYWLYPVFLKNSDKIINDLAKMGVDAYKGVTQLNYVQGKEDLNQLLTCRQYLVRQPMEAEHLIDNVLYLPVHKNVPFRELDRILRDLELVLKSQKLTSKL
ncbi:DgyrCDS8901 [Dimorphilus gyrociliatus]|uniref:DgyrCDS8901 n=1 Tax=Dimorphilus gyrociliatus TaxID=2664684 RepID=A0A7I8VXT6_9ANNE|nr:DgyrCDS8901 [Dimorphilus gyrociliatus]